MEQRIVVILESDVLKAQRLARGLATDLGFAETEAEEAAIIASELARNLVKHRAINGEIILRRKRQEGRDGLEIVSQDTGPGIGDVEQALRRSTVGTLGIGLSGVRRLSDSFEISSSAGGGTVVTAVKWLKDATVREGIGFSVMSRPKPGEDVNGDAWFIKHMANSVIFGVIDGLGHGRDAHLTSLVALELLEEYYREPLELIFQRCHEGMRHTRGAAMTLCHIDYLQRQMTHLAIGNVETRIFCSSAIIRPFCFNGTVGMRMERYRVLQYPYEEGETIVMFSDGISGRFEQQSDKLCLPPQQLADWIFRNFTREYDDATVLVGR